MFKTYFNPPAKPVIDQRNEVSLTQQSDAVDCDINCIVDRAMRTGMVDPSLIRQVGSFTDAVAATLQAETFSDAMRLQAEGVSAFESLPSQIRNRFGNSPSKLLEFLSDPGNREEAEKLGLIEKISAVSPQVGTDPSLDITVPTDTNLVSGNEKND